MALKLCSDHQRSAARALAVPSYGAMALKQRLPSPAAMRPPTLAVPSYGAMALKPAATAHAPATLAVPSYGAMALKHCVL